MFNPYDILGVPHGSTKDAARVAYRKLAMKYHPDRNAGPGVKAAEEKFKQVQGAWEMIDNGWADTPALPPRPQSHAPARSSFTSPEPVWHGFQKDGEPYNPFRHHKSPFTPRGQNPYGQPRPTPRTNEQHTIQAYKEPRMNLGEFIARPSMAEAYNGFILEVVVNGKTHRVTMPKGIPHGMRNTIPVDENTDITVTTMFTQNVFKFVGLDTALKEAVIVNSGPGIVHRTKDLQMFVEVNTKLLARGTTLDLQDFLGNTFKAKIPPDHNPRIPIRCEGFGYVDWYSSHSQAGDKRGDVLLYVVPTEKVEATNMH